jgi:hypothetical protein
VQRLGIMYNSAARRRKVHVFPKKRPLPPRWALKTDAVEHDVFSVLLRDCTPFEVLIDVMKRISNAFTNDYANASSETSTLDLDLKRTTYFLGTAQRVIEKYEKGVRAELAEYLIPVPEAHENIVDHGEDSFKPLVRFNPFESRERASGTHITLARNAHSELSVPTLRVCRELVAPSKEDLMKMTKFEKEAIEFELKNRRANRAVHEIIECSGFGFCKDTDKCSSVERLNMLRDARSKLSPLPKLPSGETNAELLKIGMRYERAVALCEWRLFFGSYVHRYHTLEAMKKLADNKAEDTREFRISMRLAFLYAVFTSSSVRQLIFSPLSSNLLGAYVLPIYPQKRMNFICSLNKLIEDYHLQRINEFSFLALITQSHLFNFLCPVEPQKLTSALLFALVAPFDTNEYQSAFERFKREFKLSYCTPNVSKEDITAPPPPSERSNLAHESTPNRKRRKLESDKIIDNDDNQDNTQNETESEDFDFGFHEPW